MGVVLSYVFTTFTTNHQAYVMIDQVSETQQNTRAVASLIERDIALRTPGESAFDLRQDLVGLLIDVSLEQVFDGQGMDKHRCRVTLGAPFGRGPSNQGDSV